MNEAAQAVFVIDDDASFLKSVQRLLSTSGYIVHCYASALDFLSQRPTEAAGCVVADLRMPTMDGLELQKELARTDNPLPVVFLSGGGDVPTSVRAMRDGAVDFLEKTVPKAELLAAIERALKRDTRERAARERQRLLSSRLERLTTRERTVLSHVVSGRLNKEIAADIGIDERSVKRHRTKLMSKLEVGTLAELVKLVVTQDVSDAE